MCTFMCMCNGNSATLSVDHLTHMKQTLNHETDLETRSVFKVRTASECPCLGKLSRLFKPFLTRL